MESNQDWHVSLHYCDSDQHQTKTVQLQDSMVDAVDVNAADLQQPFPASFDQFISAINELAGGYAEGDGSYGVVGEEGQWKISGSIFENNQALQYVELLGSCPRDVFLEFLTQLETRSRNCLIQDMKGGFFQTVDQFFQTVDQFFRD